MTTEEMIAFKSEYMRLLSTSNLKVILTHHEAKRHDFWAEKIFGSSEYAFMYDVIVHNEIDALENGYYIAIKG